MNPRFSVILLTTLIGAGQGLFIAIFTVEAAALFGLLPSPIRPWFYFYGALLAFAFTAAGLEPRPHPPNHNQNGLQRPGYGRSQHLF